MAPKQRYRQRSLLRTSRAGEEGGGGGSPPPPSRTTSTFGIGKTIALLTGAVLVVVAGYLGFDRTGVRTSAGPASGQMLQPPAGAPVDDRPDLDRLIGVYEEKTTTSRDPLDHRTMGRLYLARADLTGDIGSFEEARQSFSDARALYPDDVEALSLEARAAFSLHDFADAAALINRWLELDPGSLDGIALKGDVLLAIGDVTAAEAVYDDVVAVAPEHPAVQARLAQLAVAKGDMTAGLSRATIAESTARETGFTGRPLAWYQSFLGQLAFDTGDYARSQSMFSTALANSPTSSHDQAGVARARAAQGDVAGAIQFLELATEGEAAAVDDLGYLADLYELAGDDQQAASTRSRIEAQLQAGTLDTTVHARLAALYFLDHDVHLDLALEMAEADLAKRSDAGAWDAYAWALYKNGRTADALAASDNVLSTGVQDAGFFYRAGVIRHVTGDDERAADLLDRALELSPRFHPLHADAAERLAAQLR